MNQFDVLVIGPVSLDHNIDHLGNERKELGGAVVASGFAAAKSGANTAVFTKYNPQDANVDERFANSGATVFSALSKETCAIRNQYFTADKETRSCTSMGICDPFAFAEFSHIPTKLYHFAGLKFGEFTGALFAQVSKLGKVAVDVQCLLRHVEPDDTMEFHDWAEKKEYLPYIDFLKTDAAEAKILTGLDDRIEAAKLLYSWGAKEIMITHNTEVLIYDGETVYTCPIKARNLSGRTGRGDTTFAGYITERLHSDIPTALQYCTALVSLKMETPGPFQGTRADVEAYIADFYEEGDTKSKSVAKTLITAHSGCDHTADNSLEFVAYALDSKVDALEVDVHCVDNVLVISHDAPAGGVVPTLEAVFAQMANHANQTIAINCDLKAEGLEQATHALAQRYGLLGRVIYSGTVALDTDLAGVDVYYNAELFVPDMFEAYESVPQYDQVLAQKLVEATAHCQPIVINIAYEFITDGFMEIIAHTGITLSAWTVNDLQAVNRLLGLGVVNITTRNLTGVLAERGL